MVHGQKRGFTLLELLIVIGILAILGTVTVLVLNPAELFRQARDSQRIENMGAMRSALGLFTATVTDPDLDGLSSVNGVTGTTYACSTSCFFYTLSGTAPGVNCSGRHTAARASYASSTRVIDGNGWLPVTLNLIPGGSPLSSLPIDPINANQNFFSYVCDSTTKTFELNAVMESAKYSNAGTNDITSTDGGSSSSVYEIGTSPGLSL